jgi:hypothetical protein
MGTRTFEDKQKTALVKKFHVLLGKAGIDEDGKLAILAQYKAISSLDLEAAQLIAICNALDKVANPVIDEMDKMRKRLIASIFEWRKAMGCVTNMNEVKAIACNASQNSDFNKIPKERLQSLYCAFNNKTKDLKKVSAMTQEQVDYLTTLN